MKVRQNGLDIFFIGLCLTLSAVGGFIASKPAAADTAGVAMAYDRPADRSTPD